MKRTNQIEPWPKIGQIVRAGRTHLISKRNGLLVDQTGDIGVFPLNPTKVWILGGRRWETEKVNDIAAWINNTGRHVTLKLPCEDSTPWAFQRCPNRIEAVRAVLEDYCQTSGWQKVATAFQQWVQTKTEKETTILERELFGHTWQNHVDIILSLNLKEAWDEDIKSSLLTKAKHFEALRWQIVEITGNQPQANEPFWTLVKLCVHQGFKPNPGTTAMLL